MKSYITMAVYMLFKRHNASRNYVHRVWYIKLVFQVYIYMQIYGSKPIRKLSTDPNGRTVETVE